VRRFRMTTLRCWMIAVFVIALSMSIGMWTARMRQRSAVYQRLASEYARAELVNSNAIRLHVRVAEGAKRWSEMMQRFHMEGLGSETVPLASEVLERGLRESLELESVVSRALDREQALMRYHCTLKNKYLRAARYPWFAVSPDPPPPSHVKEGTGGSQPRNPDSLRSSPPAVPEKSREMEQGRWTSVSDQSSMRNGRRMRRDTEVPSVSRLWSKLRTAPSGILTPPHARFQSVLLGKFPPEPQDRVGVPQGGETHGDIPRL
jgi:hypothetical protein